MIKAELDIGGENADALVLVTEDEWTVLKQCYSSEPPTIMALRVRDSDGTVPGDVVLVPGERKIIKFSLSKGYQINK